MPISPGRQEAVAVRLKKSLGVPVVITEHTHETLYKKLFARESILHQDMGGM